MNDVFGCAFDPSEYRRLANIIFFPEVDSTNAVGRGLIDHAMREEVELAPTVIAAACQTQGRGRRDRSWASPDGGVYATMQGPRLESAAEVNRLERDGAAVVGMTGMPEAALARELGLEYAAIAVVANTAAGRGDSAQAISLQGIEQVLGEAMGRVRRIIDKLCAS